MKITYLFSPMKNGLNYIFIILLFILSACQANDIKHSLLLEAERIMDQQPDSALILLENISNPQKLSGSERALYALLSTQAQDKNWITHHNDSLILIAVDYYQKRNNNYRKAQAYFYLGSVYRDLGNHIAAIEAFQKAERAMKGEKNDRLMELIYENLAEEYKNQDLYDNALDAMLQSYDVCTQRNDSNDLIPILQAIGTLYRFKDLPETALTYLNKALSISMALSDSSWISTLHRNISFTYSQTGELQKALEHISTAIAFNTTERVSLSNYTIKGEIHNLLGESDSAYHYFSLGKESEYIFTQAACYSALYNIERMNQNWEKAIAHNDHYLAIKDSIEKLNIRSATVKLLNEHELATYTQRQALIHQKKFFFAIASGISILTSILIIFLIIDKNRKKKIIYLQTEIIKHRKEALSISKNLKVPPETLQEQKIDTDRLKDICFQNIQRLVILFKSSNSFRSIYTASQLNSKHFSLNINEREILKSEVDDFFSDEMVSLIELFNLTAEDSYCFILLSLGLSNNFTSICMGTSEEAVKTRKSRIKNKIGKDRFKKESQTN